MHRRSRAAGALRSACCWAGSSASSSFRTLIRGDSAITGEGRFFALHMFDAPIECQAVVLKTTKDGQQALAPLQARNLSERVHCDPIVFWSMARHICRSNRANPDFVDIGVLVRTRRVGRPTGNASWRSITSARRTPSIGHSGTTTGF